MRTKGKSQTTAITIVMILAMVFSSCQKEKPSVIKVPDFKTLVGQFAQPPAEYTTAPFFVWNAEITKPEIDKFMEGFKKAGSSQVIIHPRPGLATEYLSQNWFDLYKYTVGKGKELGMLVWIYDENSYPSGFAGGHVPDEMPESYNQGQGLEMTRTETLPDSADKYFICLKEENGSFKDITSSLAAEKGKKGTYLLFSKTYNEKSDWYGGFSYVDLLVKGVTEKFIDRTMTGYLKNLGADMGTTVPGTFTDEPQIESPGGIRWTPDLFDSFKKDWGYDLSPYLPCLVEETGDWKKIRHNYTQTLLNLFIERWSKPWNTWCEAHGMNFTGHYWEHEWPNMKLGGDNMAMYAYHQVPAIDMLFNQFNDTSTGAQFGNVRSVKELASAANQAGRQRKLSETYGGSGWDLTFTDMKRNGDWEYALGVNLMNQHLTFFTMAGARKYDYPPSFDYHEPWWQDYKYINDHFARLSLALSSGSQKNDILILEPTTSAWLYDSYVKPDPKTHETGQSFQSFITGLEKSQVEYDLGSEEILKTLGSVSEGKLKVGKACYSRVVIPPMMENLNTATFTLLERFISSGGTVITLSKPSLINGTRDDRTDKLFANSTRNLIKADNLSKEEILHLLSSPGISFANVSGGVLYHHRRILADGQLVFLVNSSIESPVTGSFSANGSDAVELNTLTGNIQGYPGNVSNKKIICSFSLPPAGSLLLFIPEKGKSSLPLAEPFSNPAPVASSSPMAVTRDQDNALMIDFCDLKLGGDVFRDLNNYIAADKVFKYYGFRNGNPWNTSVQFRTNTIDRDTFGIKTGFSAIYHFTVRGNIDPSNIRAVVERPWIWKIRVNGKEVKSEDGKWWLDRSFGVFGIGSLVKQGDNTIELNAAPMKINAEIEPVYILGDFSVNPAAKGFEITSPGKSLIPGSWKEQGLPFYSWGITYAREFNVEKPEGKWEVALGRWNGTVAEVTVNGQPATVIAFPPYRTDVSALIKQGNNKIEVKVIGSLRNLLGPHHKNPEPGFVSPWIWRGVENYPAGKDYKMFDYGLMEDFQLLKAE
jgi:hypothetical protein